MNAVMFLGMLSIVYANVIIISLIILSKFTMISIGKWKTIYKLLSSAKWTCHMKLLKEYHIVNFSSRALLQYFTEKECLLTVNTQWN